MTAGAFSRRYSLLHFLRLPGVAASHAAWRAALAPPSRPIEVLQRCLRPLLLRRTKDARDMRGRRIVSLPPRTVAIARVQFSEAERDFYQALHSRSRTVFETYVAEGRALSKCVGEVDLVIRRSRLSHSARCT